MRIQSVSDAVAVLSYLHKRELLCENCGEKIAEFKNAFHSRCGDCKSPHALYNKAEIPSVLERNIVEALQLWVKENSPMPDCVKADSVQAKREREHSLEGLRPSEAGTQ